MPQDMNGFDLSSILAPGATPEQIAQQRRIAEQLLNPANRQGPIAANNTLYFSPGMGLGNVLNTVGGNLRTEYANALQRQMQGQQAQQYGAAATQVSGSPIVNQLLGNAAQAPPQMARPMPQGQVPPMPQQQPNPNDTPAGTPMPPGQNITGPNTAVTNVDYGPVQGRQNMPPRFQGAMAQASGLVDPRLLGAIEANPAFSDSTKGMMRGVVEPKPGEDVYGRPTISSPQAGVRQMPVGGGVTPGYRAPVSVSPEGAVSTTMPQPAPNSGGGASGSLQQQVQPIFDTAKNFAQQGAAAKAGREQVSQDVQAAYNAIPIRQTLATMKDDILSHGDKMQWGPTADWMNNLKRGIAQHAPGLMSQQDLAGLASADSFEKLSAQLQTLVGRQVGSTDASLFQGMKSVPGSHNSKEGALALIDMLDQVVGMNGQFMVQNQYKIGQPGFDYLSAKNKFFEQNPIKNPISGNPIRLDLSNNSAPQSGGGWGIVR